MTVPAAPGADKAVVADPVAGPNAAGSAAASAPAGTDAADPGRPVLVGIDVGGTTVKVAVTTLDGEVIDHDAVTTESMVTPDELARAAAAVKAIVDAAAGGAKVEACGLALPGVVRPSGELAMAPNVDVDLAGLVDALSEALGVPVHPINDANAAALGELWKGAGIGARNLVFVTLGTGVGGGIVIDGQVLVGRGSTGEIGHIQVEPNGLACGCGSHGCLEMYASSRGIVGLYRAACERLGEEPVALDHDAHAQPIFEAAREGDEAAAAAVDEFCRYLARGLANLACTLDPDAFVIGGGMAAAFDLFGPRLVEAYREASIVPCRDTPVVEASLGNLAGMVGAARHGWSRSVFEA